MTTVVLIGVIVIRYFRPEGFVFDLCGDGTSHRCLVRGIDLDDDRRDYIMNEMDESVARITGFREYEHSTIRVSNIELAV